MDSLLATQSISFGEVIGLYLHIPFCHSKCPYCDFASVAGRDELIDSYSTALLKEAENYSGESVSTLFVGGGTPTVLSPGQIDRLMQGLKLNFSISNLAEGTLEANPESATNEVLARFRSHGINRLSLGAQSSHDDLLKTLGRLHTWNEAVSAFWRARERGFSNINIDLMYGLPGQTEQAWADTLSTVTELNPEHISVYALKIEAGTPFSRQFGDVDDDMEAQMYLIAHKQFTACGYSHYEISNYAKPGWECRHNLRYWKNEETIGLGVSAASFYRGRRFKNTDDLSLYIQNLNQGIGVVNEDRELDSLQQRKENVMLALRLKEGVEVEIIDKLSYPMFQTFLERDCAYVRDGRYHLTPEGWLLSNQLFQSLV